MSEDKKIYDVIAEWLPRLRKQKGLSQRDLAMKSNIPQSTITRLEKHGDQTTLKTLTKVLGSIGYTVLVAPVGYNKHGSYLKLQEKYEKMLYKFEEIRKLLGTTP